MEVIIKSFNGLGDLLFVTPTLRAIKETYPKSKITVNTNHPHLLHRNPFVDKIGFKNEGVFLGYPDPIHCVNPTKHHIMSDWEIVTKAYGLETPPPALQPEVYRRNGNRATNGLAIGVQIEHKGHWHAKKVWPYHHELVNQIATAGHEIRPIPHFSYVTELVSFIAGLRLVVCCEGGVQHIAKAVGTTAIVIYGGFAKPEWNGYDDHYNVVNPKPCSYCYNPHPCTAKVERECMREITVSNIIDLIGSVFRANVCVG